MAIEDTNANGDSRNNSSQLNNGGNNSSHEGTYDPYFIAQFG